MRTLGFGAIDINNGEKDFGDKTRCDPTISAIFLKQLEKMKNEKNRGENES
jgi:hypothetical protein